MNELEAELKKIDLQLKEVDKRYEECLSILQRSIFNNDDVKSLTYEFNDWQNSTCIFFTNNKDNTEQIYPGLTATAAFALSSFLKRKYNSPNSVTFNREKVVVEHDNFF